MINAILPPHKIGKQVLHEKLHAQPDKVKEVLSEFLKGWNECLGCLEKYYFYNLKQHKFIHFSVPETQLVSHPSGYGYEEKYRIETYKVKDYKKDYLDNVLFPQLFQNACLSQEEGESVKALIEKKLENSVLSSFVKKIQDDQWFIDEKPDEELGKQILFEKFQLHPQVIKEALNYFLKGLKDAEKGPQRSWAYNISKQEMETYKRDGSKKALSDLIGRILNCNSSPISKEDFKRIQMETKSLKFFIKKKLTDEWDAFVQKILEDDWEIEEAKKEETKQNDDSLEGRLENKRNERLKLLDSINPKIHFNKINLEVIHQAFQDDEQTPDTSPNIIQLKKELQVFLPKLISGNVTQEDFEKVSKWKSMSNAPDKWNEIGSNNYAIQTKSAYAKFREAFTTLIQKFEGVSKSLDALGGEIQGIELQIAALKPREEVIGEKKEADLPRTTPEKKEEAPLENLKLENTLPLQEISKSPSESEPDFEASGEEDLFLEYLNSLPKPTQNDPTNNQPDLPPTELNLNHPPLRIEDPLDENNRPTPLSTIEWLANSVMGFFNAIWSNTFGLIWRWLAG